MRDEKTIIGGDYVPVYDRFPAWHMKGMKNLRYKAETAAIQRIFIW